MKAHWSHSAVFYHIYPLGMCGAPAHNPWHSAPVHRLDMLHDWLSHLKELGVTALYLGPIFESSSHGYDTADYYKIDRRLGDTSTLQRLVRACHHYGIRVVLDAVFNHTGRDFPAFRDLLHRREHSPYRRWYLRINFHQHSRRGDPFSYEGWKGHHDLVKLNLRNKAVKDYLFGAVAHWIHAFDIDGLRLDAADCLNPAFMKSLRRFCRKQKKEFWLMGEVVHGNYREWVNSRMLDAVTNYELYDSLHKTHNQKDYRVLAHTLERQFGASGVYQGLKLYSFADNHDVNRISSLLKDARQIYPLYILLFTLPGIPALYYGSEWGIEGQRSRWSDRELRPYLPHPHVGRRAQHPDLAHAIQRLTYLYHNSEALRHGEYQLILARPHQIAFWRRTRKELLLIVVNHSERSVSLTFDFPLLHGRFTDLLNPGETLMMQGPHLTIGQIYPHWGRVLRWDKS